MRADVFLYVGFSERMRMGGQKSFLEKVFSYIEQNRMIPSGGAVLAGVSGGADSVGLLMALTKYREHLAACRKPPFALRAVHVEHGLRGEAALQDAAFVKQLCKEQGIPCCIVHADVSGRAKAEGLSLEEAGRLERYRIFEEISEGEERIAVAHQMEDQAETVLFHLARGSALAGIGGMRPVRRRIIRPLLGVSREEIEKYLRREGISWRTDDTNLSTDYTRNRIRHEILPLLSSRVNAQSVLHICEAAEHAARTTDYLQEQADVFLAQSARREGTASAWMPMRCGRSTR